ncbi:RHS repeat domain-containing protein [Bacteroides faecalis]|uniref:RHS repeat-associated core domain-containing protein n=1 Tax=Bacteroides faecalis TaxID=2447885 RepID=A0A401M1Y2_9BACE|nr:RHS repeat-associated core domain-containing protein [Bacteroides faecalis]GCB37849.1 hypothetical protein KGMB02408_47940 [Bacteroides faecalis]
MSVNYYDRYSFIGSNGIPSGAATAYEKVAGYDKLRTEGVKGLLTGTLTAKISGNGTVSGYLYSVMYYDERGRMIQQRGNNSLGGEDKIFTAYDFPGNPTQVRKVHTVGSDTRTEVYTHTYDPAERLLKTTYQLDNAAAVTLVDNTYDEVGRLKSDRRNGNARLKTEYAYNIRSWTKSITGTLFSQTLNYQEAITGNTPCYNGNISSMLWKAGTETSQRGYRFTYDELSRLKDALYGEGATLASNTNRFNEQITAYDKMGNILGLKRYGQTDANSYGLIDNLTLTYNGNRLQAVKDVATSSVYGNGTEFKDNSNQTVEYAYDKNGNLTKDLNKNISSIGYNFLNLPNQVIFAGGNSVLYEYAADGTKLRTVHKTGATTLTTDYCGNAIYENGVLKMLLNDAGYVSFPDRKVHFYLKDHQGNTRVVADKDGNVEERNNYYPFGGTFTSTNNVQPFKYNGKELDQKNGLNWYDYGARHYDAAIGRWHAIDPKCEKYNYLSPYVYCNNGPIDKIDPTGEDWYRDNNGNYRWIEGDEEIEGYERLGSSVSISLGDGLYLNAYQNGGIIANQAVNAFDLISGSGKLQKQFLGNQSPLSEDSKSALFNGLTSRGVDAIARPVGEFLVEQGTVLLGGKLLSLGIGKLVGQFASKSSSSIAQAAEASSIGNEAAVGTHSVYTGVDASGTVRYVGITGRDPSVRFLEHCIRERQEVH